MEGEGDLVFFRKVRNVINNQLIEEEALLNNDSRFFINHILSTVESYEQIVKNLGVRDTAFTYSGDVVIIIMECELRFLPPKMQDMLKELIFARQFAKATKILPSDEERRSFDLDLDEFALPPVKEERKEKKFFYNSEEEKRKYHFVKTRVLRNCIISWSI